MSPDQAGAALAAAHQTPATALTPRQGLVRLVAHRGSGHEFNDPSGPPENTAAAVDYGFAAGADAVEVDVWLTSDGVVVLHHDATTDRTTDLRGREISSMTLTQLQAASAGRWKSDQWADAGVPTLMEVASAVPPDRGLVVEIVEGPQVVEAVASTVGEAGLGADRAMYIAKNLDTAGAIKALCPDNAVLWIVDTTPRWQIGGWAQGHKRGTANERRGFDEHTDVEWLIEQVRERGLDGLDTLFAYPPDLPAAIAAADLTWLVWTANDPRAIDACLADGVWGITTDNTAHVREWLLAAGMDTAVTAGRAFC